MHRTRDAGTFLECESLLSLFGSQLAGAPWNQLAILDTRTNDLIQDHHDCVLGEERRHWILSLRSLNTHKGRRQAGYQKAKASFRTPKTLRSPRNFGFTCEGCSALWRDAPETLRSPRSFGFTYYRCYAFPEYSRASPASHALRRLSMRLLLMPPRY
ncbi:hypothetical protein SCG7086_AM_00060 [Chlamydiales bacterium SCGC AG-110-P3]|nr:hypothetical protein SCG7086_AM_00060 [Chlamydiales bacterium SCGC AG-110-P3]